MKAEARKASIPGSMEGGEARPTRALKQSQHSEPWRNTLVRNRPAVGEQPEEPATAVTGEEDLVGADAAAKKRAKRDEKNLPAQKQAKCDVVE